MCASTRKWKTLDREEKIKKAGDRVFFHFCKDYMTSPARNNGVPIFSLPVFQELLTEYRAVVEEPDE